MFLLLIMAFYLGDELTGTPNYWRYTILLLMALAMRVGNVRNELQALNAKVGGE